MGSTSVGRITEKAARDVVVVVLKVLNRVVCEGQAVLPGERARVRVVIIDAAAVERDSIDLRIVATRQDRKAPAAVINDRIGRRSPAARITV